MDIHVGSQLRARREAAGLTQADLSRAVGVSFQQIQKYERGSNRISASMLWRLAGALNTDEGAFFPAHGPDQSLDVDTDDVGGLAYLELLYLTMAPSRRKLFISLGREIARDPLPFVLQPSRSEPA